MRRGFLFQTEHQTQFECEGAEIDRERSEQSFCLFELPPFPSLAMPAVSLLPKIAHMAIS
jgi:hypothetical protein